MTRVIEGGEFIPMEAVAIAAEQVDEDGGRGQSHHQEQGATVALVRLRAISVKRRLASAISRAPALTNRQLSSASTVSWWLATNLKMTKHIPAPAAKPACRSQKVVVGIVW